MVVNFATFLMPSGGFSLLRDARVFLTFSAYGLKVSGWNPMCVLETTLF